MKLRLLLLLAFFLPFLSSCSNYALYNDKEVMMGTFVEVTSPDKETAKIVFEEFKRLDELLSKYKPTSEISRLNSEGKLIVSNDTFYILKEAKELSKITNGAFDVTIGPLVDLWGFSNKNYHKPDVSQIKEALNLVSSDYIKLDEKNNFVELAKPGMKIDLGAIAKGFAIDCAIKKLKIHNIKSCLINAGGQIYCMGTRFSKPWKIAIQDPRKKGFIKILELVNQGLSTSGDYEQYFMHDKKRYTHIINPKTGYPAESGIVSVTIITSNNTIADVLSTAVFVLGEAQGRKIASAFDDTEIIIVGAKDVQNN